MKVNSCIGFENRDDPNFVDRVECVLIASNQDQIAIPRAGDIVVHNQRRAKVKYVVYDYDNQVIDIVAAQGFTS